MIESANLFLADADASPWLSLFGRLHPASVHFPVALLMVAAICEGGSVLRRRATASPLAVGCLLFGAAGAALSAALGLAAEAADHPGRSLESLVSWHKWIGIATAALAVIAVPVALVARRPVAWAVRTHRALLLVVALLVTVGGYLGGDIVHGEGHILAPFRDAHAAPAVPPAAGAPSGATPPENALATQVTAIFAERCHHCHGPSKQKARLRLDDLAAVVAGAAERPIIVPGDSEASALVMRISLPADDEDVMPADGDALTPEEIDAIRRWIDAGAPGLEPAPGNGLGGE